MKPNRHVLALAAITALQQAHAIQIPMADGVEARIDTTVTLATMMRTRSPDPADYAFIPASTQPGAAPGGLVGQTGGSDLNFKKGALVSSPLKVVSEVELHGATWGLFARAAAWTDFTLGRADAGYGNYADGYATDAPLSDRGFAPSAKFDGAELRDAYLWFKASGDVATADLRIGRQVLSWGTSLLVAGGINSAVNPQDYAAQFRPGGLPQEAKVPLGMVDLHVAVGKQWNVDGFVPYEFRSNVLPGCGTFFDIASLLAQGCNLTGALAAPIPGTPVSTIGSLTERSLLANQFYLHRTADAKVTGSGQYGLAVRYDAAPLATQFGAYAMDTDSGQPFYGVTVENINGGTLPAGLGGGLARLTNPNGLHYHADYAQHVRLYGLSFDTKVDATGRVFGEVARRPNQPLSFNANDTLAALLLRSPTSLLAQTHDVLAIPAGGNLDAWDRYGVTTASLGLVKAFAHLMTADKLVLAAEAGGSHISDLPDPSVMRYGRSLAYGQAPYRLNGSLTPCSEATPGLSGVTGKTCGTDGFITANAWGLRARVAATWNGVLGAALTPSLYVAKDVRGYSYDGTFSQGRNVLRAGLRADWGKSWFGEVAYTGFTGGKYNLLSDRSNASVVAGATF